jgi:hypothetical protein
MLEVIALEQAIKDGNIIMDWRLFDLFDVSCPLLCSAIQAENLSNL